VLRRALPCGNYGVVYGGPLVASVERKSLADLVGGRLRYALAELAALPRPRWWSRTVTRRSSSWTDL